MPEQDNVKGRYSSASYIANYLAVEWGDKLFLPGDFLPGDELLGPVDPGREADAGVGSDRMEKLRSLYEPGAFYREVANQVFQWCSPTQSMKFCDISGSTGRLVYEIEERFRRGKVPPAEILLVEPTATFCQWAQLLLTGRQCGPPRGDTENEWWIPLPWYPERPHFRSIEVKSLRERLRVLDNVTVCCDSGEETPRPDRYFDVLVCLNVVDRHPQPKWFVGELARLVKDDGLLVLGSPFDFSSEFTPQKTEWVHDLVDLIPSGWEKM